MSQLSLVLLQVLNGKIKTEYGGVIGRGSDKFIVFIVSTSFLFASLSAVVGFSGEMAMM